MKSWVSTFHIFVDNTSFLEIRAVHKLLQFSQEVAQKVPRIPKVAFNFFSVRDWLTTSIKIK